MERIDRKDLKKHLRHGDLRLIAKCAGVTVNVVSRYVQGRQKTSIAGEYINALIEERKKHATAVALDIIHTNVQKEVKVKS